MPISWTKEWEASDDGTLLKGLDLRNLQQDIASIFEEVDINGGAIDGTIIGANSAAAGTFTTVTVNSAFTIGSAGTLNFGTSNQGDILYDNGTSIVRLTPGTSGQALVTSGAGSNPSWDYARRSDIFTATGADTWVCPSGVTKAFVTLVGGGGGGGGGTSTSTRGGSGGAGAETIIKHCMDVTPGNSYSVSVGAGGSGGGGDVDGSAGADSTFAGDTSPSDYTLTASGGPAGQRGTDDAGATGATGNTDLDGDTTLTGGSIYSYAGGSTAGAGANDNGTGGGASYLGKGGDGGSGTGTPNNGNNGGPGGGGGGGSSANASGGDGGDGVIIIEY